jgi:hypothetical protein
MDGIKLAVGKEPVARIDERADKSYATQVYYCMSHRRDPHGRSQSR